MAIPTLIYDGDCGFCTSAANWIVGRWTTPAKTEPWQRVGVDRLAAMGLTVHDVQAAAYWVDGEGHTWRGHRAVGRALLAAGRRERIVGALLLVPPISWLAAVGYRLAARYRYRLPGGTPACRL